MSIGKQLRQAREAQAISLDQAAQATHIRLHYLEALEANQFDLLPSSAHVRGFLRAYGDYLKLNSAELLTALGGDWQGSSIATKTSPVIEDTSLMMTNSDAIFIEIGQKLRSHRELMGLSLGDVERHTHIRMHYVRALEEGDISHLPSPVQGRGMLSNYASFLGLNTEAVLLRFADGLQASLYDRQAARNPTRPRQESTNRVPARPSQLRRLFSIDLFAGGLLIIFLLAFTIWGGLRINALRTGQEPTPTAPPVSEILLSTPDDLLSATVTILPTNGLSPLATMIVDAALITDTIQVAQTATPQVLTTASNLGSAPVQVQVVAHRHAWMRVTVDGEIAFEGRVMPGSAYSFAGNDRIVLLTGDGGGLQVYFNQQDLGLLGTFGEVAERIFSIEGIQTPTPGFLPTSTPAPTNTPTATGTPTRTSTPVTPTITPRP